jgi:hypothetical protein
MQLLATTCRLYLYLRLRASHLEIRSPTPRVVHVTRLEGVSAIQTRMLNLIAVRIDENYVLVRNICSLRPYFEIVVNIPSLLDWTGSITLTCCIIVVLASPYLEILLESSLR